MDEAVRDITSFKPSRFSRDVAKHERKELRAKVRAAEERRESAEWTAISKAIYVRDHGCCRVCGRETKRLSENPLLRAQCHHIVYRSAGGGDHSDNLINVCGVCHDQEHAHVIQITGHGDGVVSIIKTNLEPGALCALGGKRVPKVTSLQREYWEGVAWLVVMGRGSVACYGLAGWIVVMVWRAL